MNEPTVAVIILAGGYSRRMGQDKALLQLPNGLSLLAHTYQVAVDISPQVVVVTPWPARYQEVLPTSTTFIKEPAAVFNAWSSPTLASTAELSVKGSAQGSVRHKPSKGPLFGFAYGWQRIDADWCLLLPCDMPHLESAPLWRWWTWLLANSEKHSPPIASLVTTERGWQPLCGFYHCSGLPRLQHYLSDRMGDRLDDQLSTSQQRSFQPWLRSLPVLPYTQLPPNLLFNCNTLSDWQSVWDKT